MASDSTHGVLLVLVCGATSTASCDGKIAIYKVSSSNPDTLFADKCAAPGVVKCWGFNSEADGLTLNTHIFAGTSTTPTADTTTKVSGASSLKFTMPPPPTGGANSAGKWEPINGQGFGGTTFAQGSTSYYQFNLRYDTAALSNTWSAAPKFFEILYNTSICGNTGIVYVNNNQTRAPTGYTECGGRAIGVAGSGGSLAPPSPPYSYQQFGDGRTCDYPEWFTPNHPDCYFMSPDEWITFTYKLTYGTFGVANSRIEAWYKRENDATATRFVDTGPIFLIGNTTGNIFNTANFSMYMTALDPNSGVPGVTSHMWIDDFVISTQPIAMEPALAAGAGGPTTYNQSVNDAVGFSETDTLRTFGRGRLRNKINRKLL